MKPNTYTENFGLTYYASIKLVNVGGKLVLIDWLNSINTEKEFAHTCLERHVNILVASFYR